MEAERGLVDEGGEWEVREGFDEGLVKGFGVFVAVDVDMIRKIIITLLFRRYLLLGLFVVFVKVEIVYLGGVRLAF